MRRPPKADIHQGLTDSIAPSAQEHKDQLGLPGQDNTQSAIAAAIPAVEDEETVLDEAAHDHVVTTGSQKASPVPEVLEKSLLLP